MMKTKTPVITFVLGLSVSSLALAAEAPHQHQETNHSPMTHDRPSMDCSDPAHAVMEHCNVNTRMEHSEHSKRDQSKREHNPHKAMDAATTTHRQHQTARLPVSDGSAPEDIPMPFPNTMHMNDDPLLSKVMINQLELRQADQGDNPIAWEAEAWLGKDLHKLWLKTEGEKVGDTLEEAELQLLYSRAIAPYWDLQTGIRQDFKPEQRTWASLGVKGLAPYFFETDAAIFVGEHGRTAARLSGEYELMLTQKTVLAPEAEINIYGRDDPAMGIGSGLSDASVGLRLRHEFKREFAPYIGVNWSKKVGKTADYARAEGETTEDTQFVAGVRLWF
jgi:copper resistance protein B